MNLITELEKEISVSCCGGKYGVDKIIRVEDMKKVISSAREELLESVYCTDCSSNDCMCDDNSNWVVPYKKVIGVLGDGSNGNS